MEKMRKKLLIELHNVWFWYAKNEVILSNISLQIYTRQFIAIIGPNGAGKTTLMKVLCGLLKPQIGDIRSNEELVVGYIPQRLGLIGHLSVLDNILVGLGRISVDSRHYSAVLQALDLVGLSELSHHKVNSLSGGQQQRVAIARALVRKPHIILADEIVSSQDIKLKESILLLLRQAQQEYGSSVIIVTHDIESIKHVSDYLVGMKNGKIEFCDEADKIRDADIKSLYE